MLKVIFTLDYEIHGNGEGDPYKLMVEPTARLLDLFDQYGAKLTVMADVAEILRFREYKDEFGRDDYHYEDIVKQLQDTIRRGHDVQLHLHSSYFNSRFENGRWLQDWSEYNFAGLSEQRLKEMVRLGKEFLEDELRVIDPDYECYVFRAANWAVSPSRNVIRALVSNNFKVETSVFKYGHRKGVVNFDYSNVPSELVPWRISEDDICKSDKNGSLWEAPIYSEHRWIGAFLSPNRIYRVLSSRAHPLHQEITSENNPGISSLKASRLLKFANLARRYAWKADFNQCTGRQLIRALERATKTYKHIERELPFILIGHSKLFTRQNERSLEPFLSFAARQSGGLSFGKFDSVDVTLNERAPVPSAF